jgi:hypothetical protein
VDRSETSEETNSLYEDTTRAEEEEEGGGIKTQYDRNLDKVEWGRQEGNVGEVVEPLTMWG